MHSLINDCCETNFQLARAKKMLIHILLIKL